MQFILYGVIIIIASSVFFFALMRFMPKQVSFKEVWEEMMKDSDDGNEDEEDDDDYDENPKENRTEIDGE